MIKNDTTSSYAKTGDVLPIKDCDPSRVSNNQKASSCRRPRRTRSDDEYDEEFSTVRERMARILIHDLRGALAKAIRHNDELEKDVCTLIKTSEKLMEQNVSLYEENEELEQAHHAIAITIRALVSEVEMKEVLWRSEERKWIQERHELKHEIERLKREDTSTLCSSQDSNVDCFGKKYKKHIHEEIVTIDNKIHQVHEKNSGSTEHLELVKDTFKKECSLKNNGIEQAPCSPGSSQSRAQSLTSDTVSSSPPASPTSTKSRKEHCGIQEKNVESLVYDFDEFSECDDCDKSDHTEPEQVSNKTNDQNLPQCFASLNNRVDLISGILSSRTDELKQSSKSMNDLEVDHCPKLPLSPRRKTFSHKTDQSPPHSKHSMSKSFSSLISSLRNILTGHNSKDHLIKEQRMLSRERMFTRHEVNCDLQTCVRDVLQITQRRAAAEALKQSMDLNQLLLEDQQLSS